MKKILYEIDYDIENNLITFYAYAKSVYQFSYTFNDLMSAQSIVNKLESIANNFKNI